MAFTLHRQRYQFRRLHHPASLIALGVTRLTLVDCEGSQQLSAAANDRIRPACCQPVPGGCFVKSAPTGVVGDIGTYYKITQVRSTPTGAVIRAHPDTLQQVEIFLW